MTPNMQLTHDTRPDQHAKGLARCYHRWQLWLVALIFLVLAGCGGGKTVDVPRPAGLPDLTGEIAYEEEAELWLLDLGTMKAQQITTDGNNHWPTWSGDGRYLFYTHGTPPASSLYVIDMTGDRKPRLLAENACCATWLANRDNVAFLAPTAEGYALEGIAVDGSNRETLIAAIQGDWQSAQAAGNLVIPIAAEKEKEYNPEAIFATFIITPSSAAPGTAERAGSYTGPLTYAMDMTGEAFSYMGQPCNWTVDGEIQGEVAMISFASIGDGCDEIGFPGVMSVDIQVTNEGEDIDDGIVVPWVGEVDVNLQERFVVGVEFAESDTLANLNATNLFLLDYSTQERYPLEITGRYPAWRPVRDEAAQAALVVARATAEVAAQATSTAAEVAQAQAAATAQAEATATAYAQASATAQMQEIATVQAEATATMQAQIQATATALAPILAPVIEHTRVEVLIPAGPFEMGCVEGEILCSSSSQPRHTVYLDDYYMDVYEVTNARYQACVDAGGCTPPADNQYFGVEDYYEYPISGIDWWQAGEFCVWDGKRLPTEAEWEKAARGDSDTRIYPWGDEAINCTLANYSESSWTSCVGDPTPVGSYPTGISPYGLYDMSGNVAEWTADWLDESYYAVSPAENPQGPTAGDTRINRGGSYANKYGVTYYRSGRVPGIVGIGDTGVRCARTP